jgi:hypothetical protein
MTHPAAIGGLKESLPGEARQRSQVAREKWEESWIAQQRAATAVIDGHARESDGGPRPPPTARAPDAVGPAPGDAATASATPRDSQSPDTVGSHVQRSLSQPYRMAETQANPTDARSSCAQVPMVHSRTLPPEDAVRASAPPEPRAVLKRFAFWRDGRDLELAMRLRDPERQPAGILEQLRQWLREGGWRLRRVVINGRVDRHL